ncbi:hypothetical protein D3C80_776220 [compost metagenome]
MLPTGVVAWRMPGGKASNQIRLSIIRPTDQEHVGHSCYPRMPIEPLKLCIDFLRPGIGQPTGGIQPSLSLLIAHATGLFCHCWYEVLEVTHGINLIQFQMAGLPDRRPHLAPQRYCFQLQAWNERLANLVSARGFFYVVSL